MRRYPLFVLLLASLLGGCSSPGAFFGDSDGPLFKARSLSDENHVLVYLYRPQSAWADQELEAPGLFINNQLTGSLPSNGYLAVEFEVASYQLEMRRPLLGSYWTLMAESPMDFTRIASFALDAEAGATYYLRYDESNPPPHDESLSASGDGPLQLVSAKVALPELAATHRVQPFARIDANGEHIRAQRGFWRSVGRALDSIGI
ncbi:MAG: DUF2846 domain-containing protein [Pseudomonas sp.]|uniref:DUF2846 domain-containing protein n=1 Tax=Pseudomonas sp. TaxID=306 RepID=UPI00273360E9|nr:DUF2846 domain-containing protein [Pseudomonas sp.]MDP3847397.1 DUF2846 domain-containing protein [Pseudomonas sp.]